MIKNIKISSWKVNLDVLKISICSESVNMNWENLTMKITDKIKYIYVNINIISNRLNISEPNLELLDNKIYFTYGDILSYWNNNKPNIYDGYKLNKDYYLGVIYVDKVRINLGIFILDTNNGKKLFNELSMIYTSRDNKSFLSEIDIKNKVLNIGKGIIKYNKTFQNKEINKTCINDIKWEYILGNGRNYLPNIKLEIVSRDTKSINFFRNRLNP